jgi:hypothetical protein
VSEEWGIEETETTLWIGPLRKDGSGKVAEIITYIDIEGIAPQYAEQYRQHAELIASAPRLRARVAELEEGLRPFARMDVNWWDRANDDYTFNLHDLCAEDIERAKQLLGLEEVEP